MRIDRVKLWGWYRKGLARVRLRSVFYTTLMGLLGPLLSGCEPQVALWGLVTDTTGAPLPGVAVKVSGTETFAITSGVGTFGKQHSGRLTVPPGTWELQYIKTGFTSAEQTLETGAERSQEVPVVVLWPLPGSRGIFDFTGHQYRSWTRFEPERFLREDHTPVFGIRQGPEAFVVPPLGIILGHKVSPYDWRMSRLEPLTVLRDGADTSGGAGSLATEVVWAESVRIAVQAVPVDEPEQLLWEIRPSRALGPGVYAIHWGALEGDPTTDPSAYVIEVVDPTVVEDGGEAMIESEPEKSETENG